MDQPDISLALMVAFMMLFAMTMAMGFIWYGAKLATKLASGNSSSKFNSFRPALQHVRDFYSGELKPGPLYELPRLRFEHVGGTVLVEPNYLGRAPSPRPPYGVSIRFMWPNPLLRMDVYPDGPIAKLQKLVGMRDIVVGDKDFDRQYMVTSNDLSEARKLLTPRVRELIMLIRGSRWREDVHLRILGGGLWVAKRNLSGAPDELLKLVQLAIALYDAALEQPGAGIEFLTEVVVHQDQPICQVCGEAMQHPEVLCARCFTPHHEDCWIYFGGCSIYGCRGKECRNSSAERSELGERGA